MSKLDTIEVLPESTGGRTHIRFTSGEFCDIVFMLGEVSFSEDEEKDECVMSYNYDIIDNPNDIFDEEVFQKYIGDLLIELIQNQIENNELVYNGGTNADRTGDIEQSDCE